MSNTPIQEPPAQELSSEGSGQTLPSRPFQPISDPSGPKRVCFYKSGDYQFSGHRMVINVRTFKTFDALLDALSKKVPLPFGVRTITTPRGTHLVKALEDLHDGGSYLCSDQKRVKPMKLDEVNRRQVPWNTTRASSAVRRRRQGPQVSRRNDVPNRPAKVTARVSVRTPKRLEVIKNRDPSVKRTIVLQRRTAPTFEALLDYLSQILQFPVLKLYTTDGRRVDGLAALIMCAGVVVAAGNEPFKLGNYSFHRAGQMAQVMHMENVEPSLLQPRAQNNKSFSSGRGSRNFSLSSERYMVNQIKQSQNESMNGHLHHHNGSFETEVNHGQSPLEAPATRRGDDERHTSILPQEDDIEKSFRVNQDGSMTVEMKVHLTIKEEEMLHWTTTLSRSSLSKRTVCSSISESDNSSPDSNNIVAKDSSSISENETKEENNPAGAGKGICFNDKQEYNGYTSTASTKSKTGFKRIPTPGPRHVERASVESVKTLTESGVQESTLGHYSYTEKTADGETTEGYCVLQHSSSSNRPIPKPRKTASADASNKGSHSSIRSSGVAEVLQIQNNGMEVTETVMHIFESQGCYDNYFANEEYNADGVPSNGSTPAPNSKPSTDSGSPSSSNDCDIDAGWQPPKTDSSQRQTDEMLSLSSEPIASTHDIMNNLSSVTELEAQTATMQERVKKDKTPKSEKKEMSIPARNQKSSSGSDKKESILSPYNSKHSSQDKISSSTGKKNLSSSESGKSHQKSKGSEMPQRKKASKDENISRTDKSILVTTENVKKIQPKRQNINKASTKYNGHNVNTSTERPQMKKNMLDILQPKKSLLPARKTISKSKSNTEINTYAAKKSLGSYESFSVPSVNPSPSEIHQYVENWLEKVNPDPVEYTAEAIADESESRPKVVFQIGGDSESDENKECQSNLDEYYSSPSDALKKSSSFCLPVPSLQHNDLYMRGLCSSMPSVRVDPVHNENRLRSHKSVEAIGPADNEPSSSTSNMLSPRANMNPVLQKLCSSIQCISGASSTNTTSNLSKANSLPDFPSQVASAFGSSCKALMSFLSVMTLRDNVSGSALEEGNQSRCPSEAMLMVESLQKVSATGGREEQRASLRDLRSSVSSQFRERWRDFQVLRERLESEPLSPKISETEFALDVASEGAVSETSDVFEDHHLAIDELMEELNMPQEIREQISSTFNQANSFYPVEESTFVENERHQSDSDEDVEKFVEECNDEIKQPLEADTTDKMTESEQEPGEAGDTSNDVKGSKISLNSRNECLNDKGNEKEEEEEEVVHKVKEDWEGVSDKEDGDKKEINDDDHEETKREEEAEEEVSEEKMDDKGQEEREAEKGRGENEESVLKVEGGTDEVDEEEEGEKLEDEEKELVEETEEGLVDDNDQDASEDGSVEETDERECVGETEEEEEGRDEVDEEADEEEKEDKGGTEENQVVELEEDTDQDIEAIDKGEEVESVIEDASEDGSVEETDERECVGETEEEEEGRDEDDEEADEEEMEDKGGTEENQVVELEEDTDQDIEAIDEGEEVESVIEEEEEVEEADDLAKDEEEEAEDKADEGLELIKENEAKEMKVVIEEKDIEEEMEEDKGDVSEEKDESDDGAEVVSEGNNEEEDEREQEEESGEGEVKNIEERVITDEDEEADQNTEEEEKCHELGKTEETDFEENTKTGQMLEEEERESDEHESNKELEQESNGEFEGDNVTDDADGENIPEEALYLQQQNSCEEEEEAVGTEAAERNTESLSKCSSEGQCEDDKGNGTDTAKEFETDEDEVHKEERSSSLPHPVEISQELLDFVNLALQSSSLIFTYDKQGNIRIEPDNACVVQTKLTDMPKSRKDSSYGLKCLPSPSTSELSDYRPESSESGGYKSLDSVDVVTESGEEDSDKPFPVCRRKSNIPNGRTTVEGANSKLSFTGNSDVVQKSRSKSGGSFSSHDSTKASREDLSYFSASSSQKADTEATIAEAKQSMSFISEKDTENDETDGVLIDKGRWLLKENHLIRKSPPVSQGMYGDADSTSIDTGQDSNSMDSPPHYNDHNLLAAISSSELEEMAKPQTPQCSYYNMPHGSDSDPFLDDSSLKSGKKDTGSARGRGVKVSPTIDTSKTWASKNGSLSSFTSVEFKIQDRKIHPEGGSSAVLDARGTSTGGGNALQAQDSLETLRVRCTQFCPIL